MAQPFDELRLPDSIRDHVVAAAPDASNWLRGSSAREVLAKLAHGDPLGLEVRCARRLRDRAYLIGRERLVMRSLAQLAYTSHEYRSWQPLDAWISLRIDRSIGDLLDRDREDERSGQPTHDDESWSFLTNALGVPPSLARRSCIAFNDLPFVVRQVFWAVVVDGRSEVRCAADGLGSLTRVHERMARAFRTLSLATDPGGSDPHQEGADFG